MMASLVSHQSQLRVPPTPRTPPPRDDRYGNCSPEFLRAVLFPAPGGPMIMYQGSAASALCPLRARRDDLSARTALANSACMASMSPCWSGRALAAKAAACLDSDF